MEGFFLSNSKVTKIRVTQINMKPRYIKKWADSNLKLIQIGHGLSAGHIGQTLHRKRTQSYRRVHHPVFDWDKSAKTTLISVLHVDIIRCSINYNNFKGSCIICKFCVLPIWLTLCCCTEFYYRGKWSQLLPTYILYCA